MRSMRLAPSSSPRSRLPWGSFDSRLQLRSSSLPPPLVPGPKKVPAPSLPFHPKHTRPTCLSARPIQSWQLPPSNGLGSSAAAALPSRALPSTQSAPAEGMAPATTITSACQPPGPQLAPPACTCFTSGHPCQYALGLSPPFVLLLPLASHRLPSAIRFPRLSVMPPPGRL